MKMIIQTTIFIRIGAPSRIEALPVFLPGKYILPWG